MNEYQITFWSALATIFSRILEKEKNKVVLTTRHEKIAQLIEKQNNSLKAGQLCRIAIDLEKEISFSGSVFRLCALPLDEHHIIIKKTLKEVNTSGWKCALMPYLIQEQHSVYHPYIPGKSSFIEFMECEKIKESCLLFLGWAYCPHFNEIDGMQVWLVGNKIYFGFAVVEGPKKEKVENTSLVGKLKSHLKPFLWPKK